MKRCLKTINRGFSRINADQKAKQKNAFLICVHPRLSAANYLINRDGLIKKKRTRQFAGPPLCKI